MKNLIRPSVRALAAYVPGEQPRDRRVVKLNTNENPYPPSPRVAATLRRFAAEPLRRYPDPVSCDLRRVVARRCRCRVEQVFAANGSDEILALAFRAFTTPGGTVGYCWPSYSLYPVLAAIQELRPRPVPLNEDFSWRAPGRDYRADLFCLARPNAPTGLSAPKSAVRSFCHRFPGGVLIDEAYADFAADNCLDLALSLPNVLVARTLSKSYSLAGLRLGYAVGPEPLIAALFKLKDSYNLDRLAQALGAAALDDPAHMRRNAARIRATRARATAALRRMGFTLGDSQANFLWAQPPAGLPAAALFAALRRRGIYVRYFPGPLTGRNLRITVGTNAEMNALLKAIRAVLRGASSGSQN